MYVYDTILIGLMAYLLGSIPFGVVLAKLLRLPDPRRIGSGNIGATNMLRTGRKDVALVTLLLDAGKGMAAVMLARALFDASYTLVAFAVLMAALGHMYSPWLKFTGGKGVATILGGALAFSGLVGGVFCAVFLAVFAFGRYVSLASIVGLVALPIAALYPFGFAPALLLAFASAVAIYKHRSNIARLKRGEEPKMGRRHHA